MTFPILTLELKLYFHVIFLLLVFGNYTTSYVLHKSCAYFSSQNIIKTANYLHCFLLLFGLAFLPLSSYLHISFVSLIWMVILGLGIGFFFFRMEIFLYRLFFRKLSFRRNKVQQTTSSKGAIQINNQVSCLTSQSLNIPKAPKKIEVSAYRKYDFSMGDLIFAALIEEMLYRGLFQPFLIDLFPAQMQILALLLANFIFGLIHYNYGFFQLINKWIMGLFLGVTLLITHSLYIAFTAHLFFNILAYRKIKEMKRLYD
jgi:hypothetical protein